jgi:deoxyribodipyrimidine photo-lyase
MTMQPVIHWFRRDLRLDDNTALNAALESGRPVIPLFVFDPALLNGYFAGIPRLAFLLKALAALEPSLRQLGSGLVIRHGRPEQVLRQFTQETSAAALYFNHDYSPYAQRRDAVVANNLGIPVYRFDDSLLVAPGDVLKDDGTPYTVFTPFKKRWLTVPKALCQERASGQFDSLENIGTPPLPVLADFGHASPIPRPPAGEAEAARRLADFAAQRLFDYGEGRNQLPASEDDDTVSGSSFLSPYLRFGMLSPRRAYWAAREAWTDAPDSAARSSVETWVSELAWREFYTHILYRFPHVLERSFRPEYDAVAWRAAPDDLRAWQAGRTGYPVVDAAMRQLTQMGWIPNRARMIAASFLTKDLLINWREGEHFFMQWLIDGDPAANNGGWQ